MVYRPYHREQNKKWEETEMKATVYSCCKGNIKIEENVNVEVRQKVSSGTSMPKELINFSEALILLKKGRKVARIGWNGKGMWLILLEPGLTGSTFEGFPLSSYIAMKTADGKIVPWLASQTDILAEDYVEVM